MRYKRIPGTKLEISAVALGTWQFGNDAWGPVDEKAAVDTVKAALDCGVNFIDTAPAYGFGRSESMVGKAVKGRRDKVIIATKCGIVKENNAVQFNLTAGSVRRQLEESLKWLETDYVDLYQIHFPDPQTPLEETLGQIAGFIKEGKVRYAGVSNFNADLLSKALAIYPVATVQNQYSMLQRRDEKKVLPFCEKLPLGYLAYGCLGGGILSGKYETLTDFPANDARSFFYPFYKAEAFERAQQAAGVLRELAQKRGALASQIAVSWVLGHPAVTCALVGARNPDQIRANAAGADLEIAREELEALAAEN